MWDEKEGCMKEFKEFKVNVEREKRCEFYKKLKDHFYIYYAHPYYSDGYISVNGYENSDPQGNICYLENRKKTFLRIEEFNDYILIQTISNSKRTLSILKRFLKNYLR
jgi:hypothetical protein